ncbi:haloacid dehalogenase-like hydrolase family protein [Coleophoma cylindrospora]|uniref:Haloacid dehalogenase-like hydrolase family protein n=1 Tax=Coleophoma cylindrospora TaxID=1849047 RepID=A0A3D8RLW8_9HELO|nr:haloacid dehalogenase-like hydrolase family protein [Coleophoma cylindrospora]
MAAFDAAGKRLKDFRALTFDVYSTLVDEKGTAITLFTDTMYMAFMLLSLSTQAKPVSGGMFTGLQPLLCQLPNPNPYINDRAYTLAAFQMYESYYETTQPNLLYRKILPLAYAAFAESLALPTPSVEEAEAFGSSVGDWPAFPDTVAALQALEKHYRLVILSNIDNDTIKRTLMGPLKGIEFDAVYTAENIGSYKPDLKNFHYLLEHMQNELGIAKAQILHTAQSLTADHVPARQMGIVSAWIDRDNEREKFEEWKTKVNPAWRFETMQEMVQAVEKESAAS